MMFSVSSWLRAFLGPEMLTFLPHAVVSYKLYDKQGWGDNFVWMTYILTDAFGWVTSAATIFLSIWLINPDMIDVKKDKNRLLSPKVQDSILSTDNLRKTLGGIFITIEVVAWVLYYYYRRDALMFAKYMAEMWRHGITYDSEYHF